MGDYDLVVVGHGTRAIALARKARKLKARVGLITSVHPWDRAMIEAVIDRVRLAPNTLFPTLEALSPLEDLEGLQSSGVDVILSEEITFCDRQTLLVNLISNNLSSSSQNRRKLKSRRFVIVKDVSPPLRKIIGLNEIGYLTYDSLFKLLESSNLDALDALTILGGDSLSCAIAQLLHNLGVKVKIVSESRVLPEFDLGVARILQAHLEIQGIEILTGCLVTAVSDQKLWITTSLGTSTLDRDRGEYILLPSFNNSHDLNWAGAEIKVKDGEILLNSKLQTTNSHIYLCHQFRDIDIILKNCLFWAIATSQPEIPSALCLTIPVVASIGENEIAARLRYGKDLQILQGYEQGDNLQFSKVLYRSNGQIVGAHLVGDRAEELLASVAIIMERKLKVSELMGIEVGALSTLCQEISANLWAKNWRSFWFRLFS